MIIVELTQEARMNRIYRVAKVSSSRINWDTIPCASIDYSPWAAGGALPPAQAAMAFDGRAFHVRFKAWERPIRVQAQRHNGLIWWDSAVEFFFNPTGGFDGRYLNFELNAEGKMLLGVGEGREDRTLLDFDPAQFAIRCDVPEGGASAWDKPFYTVRFSIPVAFLESIYGYIDYQSSTELCANFYKCGEKTKNPHYGCWNLIETDQPDFHRPEFFGCLVME
jgi:hypothetical protein